MSRERLGASLAAGVMMLGLMVVVPPAAAQSLPPVGNPKPSRKPVQNLMEAAKRVRAGEVVPIAGAGGKPHEVVPAPAPSKEKAAAQAPLPPIEAGRADAAGEPSGTPPAVPAVAATPAVPLKSTAIPGTPIRPSESGAASAAGRSPTIAPAPVPPIGSPREFRIAGQQFVAVDVVTLNVESIVGDVSLAQYRVTEESNGKPGPWQPLAVSTELRGRHEIRTGVGVSVRVREASGATCTVGSLSRIALERRVRSDGSSHPSANIARGTATFASAPRGGTPSGTSADASETVDWIVRTPDGSYSVRNNAVSFDSINRTTVLAGE